MQPLQGDTIPYTRKAFLQAWQAKQGKCRLLILLDWHSMKNLPLTIEIKILNNTLGICVMMDLKGSNPKSRKRTSSTGTLVEIMKKLKVGIIGCGRISPFHGMPAKAQENVNLVACCDLKLERAKEKAKLFGCKKTYTDYEEMITKEKLDVVHICLPHYLHSPVTVRALELGCHVLTEKPMAISMEQAKKMVDAAKKTGKTLGVIFQNRYNAGSQLVKKCLDSGLLGKVKAAKCSVTWCRTPEYYTKSDWKGTWEMEGADDLDQAIHTITQCWLIGYGKTEKTLTTLTSPSQTETTTTSEIQLEHSSMSKTQQMDSSYSKMESKLLSGA